MQPFRYVNVTDEGAALDAAAAGARYLAGGTTLVDLMKIHVEQPGSIVDMHPLARTDRLADRSSRAGGGSSRTPERHRDGRAPYRGRRAAASLRHPLDVPQGARSRLLCVRAGFRRGGARSS